MIGDAPFLRGGRRSKEIPALGAETRRALEEMEAGAADPVATAERWHRSETGLRLRCFENWLTDRIRRQFGAAPSGEIRTAAPLPRGLSIMNIRSLIELVESVRELRSQLDVPINRSLALELLFRRLAAPESQPWTDQTESEAELRQAENELRAAGANKPGLLTLTIKDKSALYLAYMPFVKNGGLFIPTNSNYRLGDEVFMLLNLMGEDEKLPVAGRVIWVTPKGAQGKRTAGIGVQFSEQDRGQTQKKIENYLAGRLVGRQGHSHDVGFGFRSPQSPGG